MSLVPIIHNFILQGLIPAQLKLKAFWSSEQEYFSIDTARWTIVVVFLLYANFQLQIKSYVSRALDKIYKPIFEPKIEEQT